jgi:hypothetical protein
MTPEEQCRSLRTHSDAYGATDRQAQDNRVIAMEALYHLAGRNNPDHTCTGLYTGLWAPYPSDAP